MISIPDRAKRAVDAIRRGKGRPVYLFVNEWTGNISATLDETKVYGKLIGVYSGNVAQKALAEDIEVTIGR